MQKLLLAATALLLVGCAPRLQPSFNKDVQPQATDFGPHGDFMEWWYVSGYLPEQKLAFHWAEFKVAPTDIPTDVFFSHIAITDLNTGKMTFIEKNDTPNPFTGKATYPPLKLRDGEWTFEQVGQDFKLNAGPLVLNFVPQKPPVIHPPGYSGLPDVTGAMYYQSITRLGLSGTIGGQTVQGVAWLDHQWGGMQAGKQARWDWMSVHLTGGDDLMLYRVTTLDGREVQTFGSIVNKEGVARAATNVSMTPGRTWTSATGRKYVLSWQVRADEFDLSVNAVNDPQEILSYGTRVAYWEGPIQVQGQWQGQPQTGTGMMELVAGGL